MKNKRISKEAADLIRPEWDKMVAFIKEREEWNGRIARAEEANRQGRELYKMEVG